MLNPHSGLIIWTVCIFLLLVWVLKKYAWKPILRAIHDREKRIEESLNIAEKAREEIKNLQLSNEQLIKEAKEERDAILRDARKVKDVIIEEAREKADEEADKIIEAARETIHYEKMAAITELKNQVAQLSIEIAEKIIREELQKDDHQKEMIEKLLGDIRFN